MLHAHAARPPAAAFICPTTCPAAPTTSRITPYIRSSTSFASPMQPQRASSSAAMASSCASPSSARTACCSSWCMPNVRVASSTSTSPLLPTAAATAQRLSVTSASTPSARTPSTSSLLNRSTSAPGRCLVSQPLANAGTAHTPPLPSRAITCRLQTRLSAFNDMSFVSPVGSVTRTGQRCVAASHAPHT